MQLQTATDNLSRPASAVVTAIGMLTLLASAACSEKQTAQRDPATANIAGGAFAGAGKVRHARTPQQAVEHLLEAFQQRDPVLFASTVQLSKADRAFAEEHFATEAMLHEFLEALERSYGKKITTQLKSFDLLDRRGRWPTPEEAMPGLRVFAEGDRALATLPEPDGELLHLCRDDGIWRVEFAEHLPPAKEQPGLVSAYRRLRPILLKVRPLVGQPGQRAESIWKQFMDEINPEPGRNPDSPSPDDG